METRTKRQKLAKDVRFSHLNVRAGILTGEATVAYVIDGERVYYGIALCNPSDNFCRQEGRTRALRRLFDQDQLAGWEIAQVDICPAQSILHNGLVTHRNYLRSIEENSWYSYDPITIGYKVKSKNKTVNVNGFIGYKDDFKGELKTNV